jgi:hypothetical protein
MCSGERLQWGRWEDGQLKSQMWAALSLRPSQIPLGLHLSYILTICVQLSFHLEFDHLEMGPLDLYPQYIASSLAHRLNVQINDSGGQSPKYSFLT